MRQLDEPRSGQSCGDASAAQVASSGAMRAASLIAEPIIPPAGLACVSSTELEFGRCGAGRCVIDPRGYALGDTDLWLKLYSSVVVSDDQLRHAVLNRGSLSGWDSGRWRYADSMR